MPLPYTHFVRTSTIVGAPADNLTGTAPGRDPLGCDLSNATYDHTGGGSGERQLTAASGTPFASVQAGDYIWLCNSGGGVADGLYEIASVPSSTVILLVADYGLTADSTGDVDSSRGPWATLQYALDQMTTSLDELVICDDGETSGVWQPSAQLDIDQGAVSAPSAPVTIRGGNSRGVVDGTVPEINGSSLPASTNLVVFAGDTDYRRFIDLRFTAGKYHNVYETANTSQHIHWIRCRFDHAAQSGMAFRGLDTYYIDCEFDNNGACGIQSDTAGRNLSPRSTFLRCRIHDNGSIGFILAYTTNMQQCLIYDNGSHGVSFSGRADYAIFDGCVFFGNTGSGINGSGASGGPYPLSVTNCVFRSNGAYGISLSSITPPAGTSGVYFAEIDYCCFSNNTSGATSGATKNGQMGSSSGDHNVYSDPLFTSETDGSEDFRPQGSSPLIDAGISVPVK